jgi:hypothetical protein
MPMSIVTEKGEHTEASEGINPWLTIWVQPRKTIRFMIENSKFGWVFLLVCLAGISNVLDIASNANMVDKVSTSTVGIVLIGIFIGAILGLVVWSLSSLLYWSIGKLFKGTGTLREIMTASAWAFIPIVLSLILWIPDLQILGDGAFSAIPSAITPFEGIVIIFSAIVELVFSIWYVVILVKAIAEAHQFSAWKSVGTVFIPGFTIFFLMVFSIFILH